MSRLVSYYELEGKTEYDYGDEWHTFDLFRRGDAGEHR